MFTLDASQHCRLCATLRSFHDGAATHLHVADV
jgi:predicted dithiol-disulfide oxidoreductase (DUF899 family)